MQRDPTAQIGLGNHCKYGSAGYDSKQLEALKLPSGVDPVCIMYHALTIPITTDYCPDCIHLLRGRDLSSPPVSGTDNF